jgi:phage virion morphogenesis protein
MNVAIEVHDSELRASFDRMLSAGQNPQPYLRAIGDALTNSTRLRFNDSQAPDGSAWAPLSPVTLALRRKGKGSGGAKPLLDTGRLRNSITSSVDANSVTVGTNVDYGAMQHFGAKRGEFGRYSQVGRVREFGLGTFKGSAGTNKGFPIPWGNVPARPFLGLSNDDRTEILDILRAKIVGP